MCVCVCVCVCVCLGSRTDCGFGSVMSSAPPSRERVCVHECVCVRGSGVCVFRNFSVHFCFHVQAAIPRCLEQVDLGSFIKSGFHIEFHIEESARPTRPPKLSGDERKPDVAFGKVGLVAGPWVLDRPGVTSSAEGPPAVLLQVSNGFHTGPTSTSVCLVAKNRTIHSLCQAPKPM